MSFLKLFTHLHFLQTKETNRAPTWSVFLLKKVSHEQIRFLNEVSRRERQTNQDCRDHKKALKDLIFCHENRRRTMRDTNHASENCLCRLTTFVGHLPGQRSKEDETIYHHRSRIKWSIRKGDIFLFKNIINNDIKWNSLLLITVAFSSPGDESSI